MRYIKFSSFVIFIFIISFSCFASELDDVREAIRKSGAKWEAGETSVSVLPLSEQLQLARVVAIEPLGLAGWSPGPKPRLPKEWDWRDKDGQSWVTAVKSQGGCGSCWAFGSVAQVESLKMIAQGSPDPALDLSEQYMVSCDMNNYGCNGGFMDPAYNFLRDTGVPPEVCFPYQGKDLPCEDACANPDRISISSWQRIAWDVDALKVAVYEHPITCTFYVYRDFLYYQSGVYKHVEGGLVGAHAVCIVGWVHKQHCFIAKNSWGTGWGESGYFRIAFSEAAYKSDVKFGVNAGSFEMLHIQAPGKYRAVAILWGELKS